jgi:hypothetical protein
MIAMRSVECDVSFNGFVVLKTVDREPLEMNILCITLERVIAGEATMNFVNFP